jgi:hypothetical protein
LSVPNLLAPGCSGDNDLTFDETVLGALRERTELYAADAAGDEQLAGVCLHQIPADVICNVFLAAGSPVLDGNPVLPTCLMPIIRLSRDASVFRMLISCTCLPYLPCSKFDVLQESSWAARELACPTARRRRSSRTYW